MKVKDRLYKGEVVIGSIWSAPNERGEKLRRIRIVAQHIDGDWIYEELPSIMYKRGYRGLGKSPDFNLRYVFKPEDHSDCKIPDCFHVDCQAAAALLIDYESDIGD